MFGGKASFHEQQVGQNFQEHHLGKKCQEEDGPGPTWSSGIPKRYKPSSRLLIDIF
jgi:hypothetical protein